MRKTLLAAVGLLLSIGAYGGGDPVTYTTSQLTEMAATGERPNYELDTQDMSSYKDLETCGRHLEEFLQGTAARYDHSAPPGNLASLGYYTDKLKETSCIHVEAVGGRDEKWNLFRVTNQYHLPKWGEEESEVPPATDSDVPAHCDDNPEASDCPWNVAHDQHCEDAPDAPECQPGYDPNAPPEEVADSDGSGDQGTQQAQSSGPQIQLSASDDEVSIDGDGGEDE